MEIDMKRTSKIVGLIILVACVFALSSCALLFGTESGPKYEIAGTWRRTAGEWNSTITYYFKADGTFSYSNNQNGDLDSGEYTVNWEKQTINTIHQMNTSRDKKMKFSFKDHETLILDGYTYKRI